MSVKSVTSSGGMIRSLLVVGLVFSSLAKLVTGYGPMVVTGPVVYWLSGILELACALMICASRPKTRRVGFLLVVGLALVGVVMSYVVVGGCGCLGSMRILSSGEHRMLAATFGVAASVALACRV